MTPDRSVACCSQVDLPSWLAFPDVERVGWVNTVVKQLWPHIARAVQARPCYFNQLPQLAPRINVVTSSQGLQTQAPDGVASRCRPSNGYISALRSAPLHLRHDTMTASLAASLARLPVEISW